MNSISAPVCIGNDTVFEIMETPSASVEYNINGGATQAVTLDASGVSTVTVTAPAITQTLNLLSVNFTGASVSGMVYLLQEELIRIILWNYYP